MGKPRLIILIRHAQSEGNKNREIHQTIPDHRVKLTSDGWAQAHDAGRRLRKMLRPDDKIHFFTSPYRRTRETTEGILNTLTADDEPGVGPSPFRRSHIKVYEEPRLREQDFGNFQPCSAEMERMWQERADYGHFFYRIPNGESAADAYDRVSGFNESLWRQFGEDDCADVCVLVTHGLMSRIFLMKWYHFTVEYFEDLRNVNHCEFLIMRKDDGGKYVLENKLRTWSELRLERALSCKDNKMQHHAAAPPKTHTVVRRWGGCPDGCNHKSTFKRREDLEVMRQRDVENGGPAPMASITINGVSATIAHRRHHRHNHSTTEDSPDQPLDPSRLLPQIDLSSDIVSSPDGTPSFISVEDRLRSIRFQHLHIGRDFGGSYSGHASAESSDNDHEHEHQHGHDHEHEQDNSSDEEPDRQRENGERSKNGTIGKGAKANGASRCANVIRLGDAPASTDGDDEREGGMEDLDQAEAEDRSIRGSVY